MPNQLDATDETVFLRLVPELGLCYLGQHLPDLVQKLFSRRQTDSDNSHMDHRSNENHLSDGLAIEDVSEAEKMPMISEEWDHTPAAGRRHKSRTAGITLALAVSLIVNAVLLSLWLLRPFDLDEVCIKHTSATCQCDAKVRI